MTLTRDRAVELLAWASLWGNLGLFVGSGFSIALTKRKAPNFKKLIQELNDELVLNFDLDDANVVRGLSYPQIADRLLKLLYDKNFAKDPTNTTLENTQAQFKKQVASQCDLHADSGLTPSYRAAISQISPSWVITTNYDFILETLIDNAITLLPETPLVPRQDYVPVYHIHGHRSAPDSIIITEADYVKLFRPMEYRQIKLALLLTESATLMLGYAFGDINVRSAQQLSRAISGGPNFQKEPYQQIVIQALHVSSTPKPDPYLGPDGEIIVEISDILTLLLEIGTKRTHLFKTFDEVRIVINDLLSDITLPRRFMTEQLYRLQVADMLKKHARFYRVSQVEKFLDSAIDPEWTKARMSGGFAHYDNILQVIMDLLEHIPFDNIEKALFSYLARWLGYVASVIEPSGAKLLGSSFQATATWLSRKAKIPTETTIALKNFSKSQQNHYLDKILA